MLDEIVKAWYWPLTLPLVTILPIVVKLPVMIADPVNGNGLVFTVIGKVVPLPLVNVIVFEDTEAVYKALGSPTEPEK